MSSKTVRRIPAILLVAGFALSLAMAQDSAADREAIKTIAASWQDAWNRRDAKALSALVADDLDFVTVSGLWLKTRKDFEDHHAIQLMQSKDSVWASNDTKVKFVNTDLAVAHIQWTLRVGVESAGAQRQPRTGIFTWVLKKQKGRWLIIAAQNTNVREPPAQLRPPVSEMRSAASANTCEAPAVRHLRTILYFGLARPAGTVSEAEWQAFVRDEITPRFPEGLTAWEVDGQYRQASGMIVRERSKVLLLVHTDTSTAREKIESLVARYKQMFEQESVLWETATVCVIF